MDQVIPYAPGSGSGIPPSGEGPGDGLSSLTTVVSRALRASAFIVSIVGGRLPTITHTANLPDMPVESRDALLTSLCLGAATNRETLVVEDADTEGAASGLSGLGNLGVRACICTPLRLDGWRIRGLLAVIDERPRDWSEEALALVSDVGQIAAMEMRVEAGMQVSSDSRQLAVRRSVIEGFLSGEPNESGVDGLLGALGEELEWDAASIWLSDSPSTLRCIGGWSGVQIPSPALADLWADQTPIDESDLLAKVLSHQEPVWMPDLEVVESRRAELARAAGLESALWFPLRCSGALGAVELLSLRHRRDADRMPLLENSMGRLIGSLLGLDWRVAGSPPSPGTPPPLPTHEAGPPPLPPAVTPYAPNLRAPQQAPHADDDLPPLPEAPPADDQPPLPEPAQTPVPQEAAPEPYREEPRTYNPNDPHPMAPSVDTFALGTPRPAEPVLRESIPPPPPGG